MKQTTIKRARLGWRPDVPDGRDHIREHAVMTLPARVDLHLTPLMPPIYDQGQIGSCTANAIAGAVQYDRRKLGYSDIQPSRLFIYYNERAIEGSIASDSGAQIRDGIKSIAKLGVCPEPLWPYSDRPGSNEQTGAWKAGAKAAKKPPARAYKAAKLDLAMTYARVTQTLDALRTTLAGGLPIVFGFAVYENLWDASGTPRTRIPMPSGQSVGGHAVVIVGYDDVAREFIIRNSWGTGVGDAGYFYMPYAYVTNPNLCDDFWVVRQMEK